MVVSFHNSLSLWINFPANAISIYSWDTKYYIHAAIKIVATKQNMCNIRNIAQAITSQVTHSELPIMYLFTICTSYCRYTCCYHNYRINNKLILKFYILSSYNFWALHHIAVFNLLFTHDVKPLRLLHQVCHLIIYVATHQSSPGLLFSGKSSVERSACCNTSSYTKHTHTHPPSTSEPQSHSSFVTSPIQPKS